jgi:hypothetical protein
VQTESEVGVRTATEADHPGVFRRQVRRYNGGPVLVTGAGVGAVAIPKALSGQVLEGLERHGCSGPTLSVPTRQGTIVILLVETDSPAIDEESLPAGVRVLTAGTAIPLPATNTPDDLRRWIVAPELSQRWLPGLAAVLTSIRSACRVHLPVPWRP